MNYFKIAFRSLLKFKGYSSINLLGLSLGLATGILMLIYALDEISYDNFHTKENRIYRVSTNFFSAKSESSEKGMDTNGWAVGSILRKDYPEVEAVLYTRNASSLMINHEGKHLRQNLHYASPEFFDIFSFKLKKGNANTALTDPYSLVITESMEQKFFPGQDALNKTLVLGDTIQFVVTGVLENIPSNSHIQFDMLVSFSTYEKLNSGFSYDGGWGNINMRNYVLLREGSDPKVFAAKAKDMYSVHAGEMLKTWGISAFLIFEPLRDIYLKTKNGNGLGPVGSEERVYLVSGIAVFVILLACINFINLATARSVYRAKEVGLRKVVGSTRQSIIGQFLSESFLLTLLSFCLALVLAGLMLPFFNELLGKSYQLVSLTNLSVVSGMLILVLLVTLLSGYYPAWVISAMRPAEVLKGKLQSRSQGVQLRRSLVVFQFVIAVTLVIGALIVVDQLNFMQKKDLGFAKDEIFVVNGARARSSEPNAHETFKNELKALAIVDEVTFANSAPGNPGWMGQVAFAEGTKTDQTIDVEYMAVDTDYLKTLGLKLVAGRDFDPARQTDLETAVVINETAAAGFGWGTENAIGKKIDSPSGFPKGEVIGVVKDYHQFGLQQNIHPMVMEVAPRNSYLYIIRYKASDTQQLINTVSSMWQKKFEGYDFNYFFLNQDFERQYQSEQRLAKVFGLFAGITILIASIGLLGLVSFMVTARTKEIGVRKVLGAGVFNITKLLSKEFVVLVMIASFIAFPIAWFFASEWLQNFSYRTSVDPMLFVWTFLIALFITCLTVSYQTVKAAMTNPVKSLRYE